ncbi:LytR/AlgR family response regulator transcription factor [Pontibacter ruber]|uniref:LytR/AlgR family response regulator transcription factor n=1 Tax=Pontibacter ruber TaxID=1343895 RepID=A0ABW5D0M7_9BACT|nr:LytTR family DNA-binding domain-containing protein [Pontibacter ruber]
MSKYKTIVVDDEPAAREGLAALLQADAEVEVIGICANALEAIDLMQHTTPDILFLDIQMPEVNGFELLRSLSVTPPAVAFVTAYDQYAIAAFEHHAIDYLLKPFTNDRFRNCLAKCKSVVAQKNQGDLSEKIRQLLQEQTTQKEEKLISPVTSINALNKLSIKANGKILLLDLNDIWYFEAEDYYVNIHYKSQRILIRDSIKNLEQLLAEKQFCRIHKSSLVNLQKVTELENHFNGGLIMKLQNNTELKVSKNHKQALLERFGLG